MNETINQTIPMIERVGVAPFTLLVLAMFSGAALIMLAKAGKFAGPLVVRFVESVESLRDAVQGDREMIRDTNQKVTAIHRAWVSNSEEDEANGPYSSP